MSSLSVPCTLVDKNNLQNWWPHIIESLSRSDFIAIDLELSGLGSKDLFASQVDERYKALKEVASTRAILSMGLACFKIDPNKGFFKLGKRFKTLVDEAVFEQICDCIDVEDQGSVQDESNGNTEEDKDFHISVTVFDFLCLCNDYVLESRSMKFLVQQGFDFNQLARSGISFMRGNDMKFDDSSICSIRTLLMEIIAIKPIIVFHNGLLDLAFIYQNFYAELPSKLEIFAADLFEMFPNGIYDTKYIAQFGQNNSYLEYLFNQSLRRNYFRKILKQPCLNLGFEQFSDSLQSDIRHFDLSAKIFQANVNEIKICDNYSKYGWCEKMDMCQYSHNIDLILDNELSLKKDSKSKKLTNHLKSLTLAEQCNLECVTPMRKSGSHHSGNDAFMTGYYFLFYLVLKCNKSTIGEFRKFYKNMTKFKNKIFLSGKTHPFNIMRSNFAATSSNHKEKLEKIRKIQEKLWSKKEGNGTKNGHL